MNVGVCRPKLFKNLCLSLVSGVPPLLFQDYTPGSNVTKTDGARSVSSQSFIPMWTFTPEFERELELELRQVRLRCCEHKA